MTSELADVVIVGAGKGGSQTAASLRDEGFDGRIVLLGDEARLPYDRPPLSKAFLTGDESEDDLLLRAERFYEEQRIDLALDYREAGHSIDRRTGVLRTRDGRDIAYGNLVLSTGAQVRPLPVPGAHLGGVCGLRSVDDALELRAQLATGNPLVVIGGGFIGLEIAAVAATRFGCPVTLIEAQSRLLARTTLAPAAEHIRTLHERLGVEILLDTGVVELVGEQGRVTEVVSTSGRRLPASAVAYGIGVIPRTELAVDAGLEVANGILVDEWLSTEQEGVWAIGDCAAYPSAFTTGVVRLESVQNATDQARHVAKQIVTGTRAAYTAVPWFWSDQADLRLQSVGITTGHTSSVVIGDESTDSLSVLAFRDDTLLGADSVNAPGDHMAVRKLLGLPDNDWRRDLTPARASEAGFTLKGFLRESLAVRA